MNYCSCLEWCRCSYAWEDGFKAGLEAAAKLVRSQLGLIAEWDIISVFPKPFYVVAEEILAIEVPSD